MAQPSNKADLARHVSAELPPSVTRAGPTMHDWGVGDMEQTRHAFRRQ